MSELIKTPRKSLNKAFLKLSPLKQDIDSFKEHFANLITKMNPGESEEFHKNLISEFLKRTYYHPQYFINTKGWNDLVIHNGADAKHSVGVIIETKKPGNKSEMPSCDNINKKALHETVLYYLRERITEKNLEIKHIIITNIEEWFVFDANLFERYFADNKSLVQQFIDFERDKGKPTDYFYKNIAAPLIEKIKSEMEYTFFTLTDCKKAISEDNKTLIALFKFFSPQHLLKLPFLNDNNSLNKEFYSELLHIIGLVEKKDGAKKLIERKPSTERDSASLLESTITQLRNLGKVERLPNAKQYGETLEERYFSVALELSITWINRILFLKLLEAQSISYHQGSREFAFLTLEKIKTFHDLNDLFFAILAKKPEERQGALAEQCLHVPYLNSSLFEPTELENQTICISNLRESDHLPIFSSSVLKDNQGRKQTKPLPALSYLFGFLEAYDFASEGKEEIRQESKTLINAAVLGLIFEKINGYKDGSFFTPSFITMYMSSEAVKLAVLQKFNTHYQWNFENLTQLYNKIDDRTIANELINSLKICDPAVGSGHFLVSVLNELIAIKSRLGILVDKHGKRLKEYHIEIINDELVVTDSDGDIFEYKPNSPESQRVQETLFHEKQILIENCLFGVDINPNSVKICRLRLWIELLKNAYYQTGDKQSRSLETLPNIDINIKCGNSLISRFPLDGDIKKTLKKSKRSVESYRNAVATYRNAKNKQEKWEMETLIQDIKSDFKAEIYSNDPKVQKIEQLKFKMKQYEMFPELRDKAVELKMQSELKDLEAEIAEILNNKIYQNAFEWRFEFPEVLNSEGDFIGFDLVIGNPPYGVSMRGKEREYLNKEVGKVPDFEIYYWFINKAYQLLKHNGALSYIIPNTIIFNIYAQQYRLDIFKKWNPNEVLDCTDFAVFNDATVRNIIILFVKTENSSYLGYKETNNILSFKDFIKRKTNSIDKNVVESHNQNWGLIFKLSPATLQFISRIRRNNVPLSNFFPETSQGLIAYDKYQGQSQETIKNRIYHSFIKHDPSYKEWIYGSDVKRYKVAWNKKEYIQYCKEIANPRDPKFFNGERILIREITNPRIYAAYTNEELYHDPSVLVILDNKKSPLNMLSLLAILNSKFATFYHFNSSPKATKGAFPKILVHDINNFPLPPDIDDNTNSKLQKLSHTIALNKIAKKQSDKDNLEAWIDQLVYKLYGLSNEEIALIEAKLKEC